MCLVTTPYGKFMQFNRADYIMRHMAVDGFWDYAGLYHIQQQSKPDMAVIDVGAYCGFHTVCASHHAKHVFSFEPHPDMFDVLQCNLRINKIKNVTAFNVACYDRETRMEIGREELQEGHIRFEQPGKIDFQDSFNLAALCFTENSKGDIPALRLDSIPFNYPISMVKIDAQGADLHVLRGADGITKQWRPAYLVEWYPYLATPHGSTFDDLLAFCKEFNYTHKLVTDMDYLLEPL